MVRGFGLVFAPAVAEVADTPARQQKIITIEENAE
jgi:hypothetical protein